MKRASSSNASVRRHSAQSPPTETLRSGATASVRLQAEPRRIRAYIESVARGACRRSLASFTDAETPLINGIRVEWMSYSNKLLRGNRSACIPN